MSLKGSVTVGPEAPLVLTAGKNSNLPKWTKSTFLRMQEKFGRIANVMKTDKPHEIPPLEPSDYTPHGDHGLSENAIMAIQVDQTKSRMRRVRDLLNSMRRYYKVYLLSLIERHPDFAANDLVQDPNVLWTIIKEIHSTNTTGGGQLSLVCNKVTMRADFDSNYR